MRYGYALWALQHIHPSKNNKNNNNSHCKYKNYVFDRKMKKFTLFGRGEENHISCELWTELMSEQQQARAPLLRQKDKSRVRTENEMLWTPRSLCSWGRVRRRKEIYFDSFYSSGFKYFFFSSRRPSNCKQPHFAVIVSAMLRHPKMFGRFKRWYSTNECLRIITGTLGNSEMW